MKKLTHIPQLDGLRAVAVLMVLVMHFFSNTTWPIKEHFPSLYIYVSWFWAGVDLFFVLSGFLIGRILLFNKGSESFFKTFYVRRALRIFPAYYFVIIMFILFDGLVTSSTPVLNGQHPPIWTFFLYIQNFFFYIHGNAEARWLSVTWSLAIEEQFYLILPFLIYVLPKRFIPFICVTGVILAPIFRFYNPGSYAYVMLFSRMDALLIGVLIAYYHLEGKTKFNQWYALIGALLGGELIRRLIIHVDFEKMGLWYNHSILAIVFGIVLLFAINSKGIFQKALTLKPLVFVGKISYMMYLTHQIFNGAAHYYLKGDVQPVIANWTDAGITIAALTACIIFCHFSYKYFEGPILRIGKNYNYSFKQEIEAKKKIPI